MHIAKVFAAGFLALGSVASAGDSLPPGTMEIGLEPFHLPASLDAFYPPATDRPVYLIKMLSLETSFSGIMADLMEGDLDGARGSFDDFQRQYREAAGMIPEWKGEYPEEKIKELGRALAAEDQGRAVKAFESTGQSCHGCHLAAMVPVQQKYHWGDFGAADVWDPVSGKATGYRQFKQYLTTNMANIKIDLQQGQTGNARKHFEAFQARFEALSGTCRTCHEKESRHFVDHEMQNTVEELRNAFRSEKVDAEQVTGLMQKIGKETCSKCHLVHLPAAHARHSVR